MEGGPLARFASWPLAQLGARHGDDYVSPPKPEAKLTMDSHDQTIASPARESASAAAPLRVSLPMGASAAAAAPAPTARPTPAPAPTARPAPAPPATNSPVQLSFDRGTLLWLGPRPTASQRRVGRIVWDPRSQVHRAPAWRYGTITRELAEAGQRYEDVVAAYGSSTRGGWKPIELRPYQRAALGTWDGADRRGLLVLPTGSGKTRIAMAAMALSGCPSLCLVPTRVLLHQWRGELERWYGGPVGIWGDGEREVAPIMVITFESAYRHMARLGNRYRLLVVDEAHHFGSGARDEALEMAIAPYRLGLTATPPADGVARTELERLVGPTVFHTSVRELSGTYLADLDVVELHVPLEPDERAAYDAAQSVFRPFFIAFRRMAPRSPWKDFVAAAMQSREGRAALTAWRRGRSIIAFTRGKAATVDALLGEHRNDRVLIFTADNDTAYAIARRNLVMPLTCDIKRQEREEVLARFQRGELRALVSARVLNEGIDVPDANVAIVVGGTQGQREHIQRVGRLLRPAEGKRATVYELVAEDTSETRQAERRRQGLGTQ